MGGSQTPIGSMPHHKFLVFSINGATYYYSMRGILFVTDAEGLVRRTTDEAVAELVSHKNLTNSILRRHGFSVPEGVAVQRDAVADARAFFSAFLATAPEGVCVKPADGRKGRKVYVGVRDLPAFLSAFKAVARTSDQVLIEEVVAGMVYRFFCVAGRVVAIRYGVPANVEGDGEHSVSELLEIKNRQRMSNPFAKEIRVTGPGRRLLEAQGMSLASIPAAGDKVWLSRMSNLDQGADIVDATDSLHPSYTALVERAVQCFPDLILCGADVAIENPSAPATSGNHHFIELNEGPGFEAHHFPSIGKPRDVAGAIVDYLMTRR
jgi:cyanophycin synthetase